MDKIKEDIPNQFMKIFVFLALAISFFSLSSLDAYSISLPEPASGYFVQHGTAAMSTLELNIPITLVSNTSRTFVIVHQWEHQPASSATVAPNYAIVGAYLKNESAITLSRTATTRNIQITWMVVEALSEQFYVQHGKSQATLNAGVLFTDIAIPVAVDVSNSFAWQNINTTFSSNDADDMMFYANITTPTTLRISRGGGTNAFTGIFNWQVIEWNASKISSFQKGATALVGNEDRVNPKIEPINIIKNQSFIFAQCIGTGGSTFCDQAATAAAIKNDTALMFYTHDTANSLGRRCLWTVIDFGQYAGNRSEGNYTFPSGSGTIRTDSLDFTVQPNISLAYTYGTSSVVANNRYPSGSNYYSFNSTHITYNRVYVTANAQMTEWEVLQLPFNYFPNVTSMISPADNNNLSASIIDFNFTVTDNIGVLTNCSLWGNFSGTWVVNTTLLNPDKTGVNNITLNIPDGVYKWTIDCYDNYGDGDVFNYNYTFSLDATPPRVETAMLNATEINQTHKVRLNVSITDAHNITSATARFSLPDTSLSDIALTKGAGNEYYIVFNATTLNGTYSVEWISATDSYGNINQTDYTNLKFNVTMSPPLEFDLISPTNRTESGVLKPNMSWSVAYDEHFSNYTLLLSIYEDFSAINQEYSLVGMTNTSKVLDNFLTENTIYYWKIIAQDLFGSSKNSTSMYSYITDNTAPTVLLLSPQSDSFAITVNTSFNFTPNDLNTLNACALFMNLTGEFLQVEDNNNLSKAVPNEIILNISEGVYLWNILCNDSSSNAAFGISNRTIIVDLTPPNITLLFPNNTYYENTTNNVVLTINVTDKWTSIAQCSVIIDDVIEKTRDNIFNGVPYNFTEFMLNGNYTWNINCTDSNGFEYESEKRNITIEVVDRNPPFPTLNFPTIDHYSQIENVTFNYTPEDATGIENCSLYINNLLNQTDEDIENFEYNYFTIENFEEERYNWSIGCTDNSTETNFGFSSVRSLTIDLTPPSFVADSFYPQDGAFVATTMTDFIFIPNESNIDYCALYGNFTGNWEELDQDAQIDNLVNNTISKATLDGIYIWNILCMDETGRNVFYNTNYTLNVDTSPPTYSDIVRFPLTNSPFSRVVTYEFNITWTDGSNVDTVFFEHNLTGILINETLTDIGGGVYLFDIPGPITVGDYAYKWYANDSLGNLRETTGYTYTITQTTPIINITFNATQGDISINQSDSLNISASVFDGDVSYLELYLDGVMINSGDSPFENLTQFPNPGVFNITAVYYSTQNYTEGSTTFNVNVIDRTHPIISIIYPLENESVGSLTVIFQYNISDFSTIQNCELYINGTLNDTDDTITQDTTQSFTIILSNETYNFQIKCLDAENNLGVSEIINFTVSPVPALTVNITPDRVRYTNNFMLNATIKTYAGASLVNTNIINDIILGNTSVPWWNGSWIYRKPIYFTEIIGINHDEWVTFNITGLNGNISNCTEEIRIVKNHNTNLTLVTSNIISGDDSTYCYVEFNANIAVDTTNMPTYHVYYGNPTAANPNFSFTQVQMIVQSGQINAASGTMLGATLSRSVDRTKSFLIFSSLSSGTTPSTGMFTGNITNTNTINFTRAATAVGNISWQVVEHPWINVYRGMAIFSNTGTAEINMTLSTPVNVSRSFIIINGRVTTTTAGRQNRGMFTASFVNSTTIKITRSTTGTAGFADYQVVEWNGAQVQNGSATLATTAITSSTLPTSVDKDNSFLIFSTRAVTATNIQDVGVLGWINTSNQVVFRRVGTTGTVYIEYFVVTLPGSSSQELISPLNAGTILSNTPIPQTVVLNKTFSISSWNTTGAVTTFTGLYHIPTFTSTVNLKINKQISTYVSSVATYVNMVDLKNGSLITLGTQEKFIDTQTGATGTNGAGTYYFIWNTTNTPYGNYILVTSTASGMYSNGVGAEMFEIIQDITPPNITLTSPVNTFNTSSSEVNFSFTPSDEFSFSINCTLNINGSVYPINTSKDNVTQYTIQNLNPSHYYWNVTCSDNKNNTNTSVNRNFTVIGKPTLINITYNLTDNKSMILSWSAGIGATSYDVYITTDAYQIFSSTPNVTAITALFWEDQNADLNTERYYQIGSARGTAKIAGDVVGAKKTVELDMSIDTWKLVSFPFNITQRTLGNFTLYKNPVLVSPSDAIINIYQLNGSSQSWKSATYNLTGKWDTTEFTTIDAGKGYWIELNKSANLTYYGIVTNNTFNLSLYQGWNLIGSTSSQNITLTPLGIDAEPPATPFELNPNGAISQIYGYTDSLNWPLSDHYYNFTDWYGWFSSNGLDNIEPSKGYYAKADTNATWMVGR